MAPNKVGSDEASIVFRWQSFICRLFSKNKTKLDLLVNMSFNQEQITEALLTYIRKNMLDDSVIFDNTTSLSSVGLDSVSIIDMIVFIERKYGIVIEEKDMLPENFYNVEALVRCSMAYI